MSKPTRTPAAMLFAGIDVSANTLSAALADDHQMLAQREFANSRTGHSQLIAWLRRPGEPVRVTLEATGVYSLDLALALDRADGIQVAVLNPKLIHRFAQTLRRSKTDAADAVALAQYSRRMPFAPWQPPRPETLALRALSRHITALGEQLTRDRNRLHAAQASTSTPRCLLVDLKRALASLQRRILRLRRHALALVHADAALERNFHLLTAIPGIAQISALHLLAELTLLPGNMSVRQWVASSGLDPVHCTSGTSIHRPSRISRAGSHHLRRALYMPALVAVRHDPHLRAFYETLLTRHKAKLQALIAVARKILHAIYGIFKTHTPYDGAKLFPNMIFTS